MAAGKVRDIMNASLITQMITVTVNAAIIALVVFFLVKFIRKNRRAV